MRSASGRNMVWASLSSWAEIAFDDRKQRFILLKETLRETKGKSYLHDQTHDGPEVVRILGDDLVQGHPCLWREDTVILWLPSHCQHSPPAEHLLHLLVLSHAGVGHEQVRVILFAERNLLHGRLVQLSDQLSCEGHRRRLRAVPAADGGLQDRSVLTPMHLSVQDGQGLEGVVVCGFQGGDLLSQGEGLVLLPRPLEADGL